MLCLYSNNCASYLLFGYVLVCFVYIVIILLVIFYLDMYCCASFIPETYSLIHVSGLYSYDSASYLRFRYVLLCFVYTVMILLVIFYLDMYCCASFIKL